jgi:hypothetical protein
LQRDTEPAPGNATILKQSRHDALESRFRNNKNLSARSESRNANEAAANIENGAALFLAGKPNIELDAPINQATVPAVPFGPKDIDDAKARACAAVSVRSNRDRDRARSGVARVKRKRDHRRGKTQDRDVSGRIAASDLGPGDGAICCHDFKLVAVG